MVRLTETATAPTIGEPNQTQFVQVEREREREQNRPATVGTGISGILPMVGQPRIDGGRNISSGGCGFTEGLQNGTKEALQGISQSENSGNIFGLLDVAMQAEPPRCRTETRPFNPDPQIADYKDAEEVFKIFLEACK